MSQSDFLSKITADYEAVFNLIDVVFSLESCLRYQVLPLELVDNHLVLGLVDPKDKRTIKFINPIVSSLGHTFHIQSIDAQTHQLVLAAYLKRSPKNSPANNSLKSSKIATSPTLVEKIPENPVSHQPLNNSATLIDVPENPVSHQPLNNSATLIDVPEISVTPTANLHERPTFIVSQQSEKSFFNPEKEKAVSSQSQTNNLYNNDVTGASKQKTFERHSILELKPAYLEQPIESLKNLAPDLLWQELLARVLSGGEIGRLYLQQHHGYGCIMCSRDGVVKSSLDKVPLAVFEGVTKEIKIMAKLSLNHLEKPKKVAIQKFYNQERVLLRAEFFEGKYGEEITIQVLRGQALRFYEQRQADKTLEQAIHLGQKLEKTLKKIRMCKTSADIGDLSTFKAIMKQIERQLNLLDS